MADNKEDSGVPEASSVQRAELAALDAQISAARTQLTRIQELVALANTAKSNAEAAQLKVWELQEKAAEQVAAAQGAATKSAEMRDSIVRVQTEVAEKSEHVEDAKNHADSVRKALNSALESTTAEVAGLQKAKEGAEAAANEVKHAQDESKTAKDQIDTNAAAVKAALEAANKDALKTKALAEISETIEAKVTSYQQSLAALEKQSKEQLEEIKRLLPGATSAGLASAFDSRGKIFTTPAKRWQWIFVGALTVLVLIAAHGLWQVHDLGDSLTYGRLIRLWLSRLPIAGSLVWLALYSSREAALAKRLEEDYAYKAAVSTSFQGFQQQMREVQADAGPDTPLAKLCANTLSTISSPPGRIYDKHNLIVTPTDEVVEFAKWILQKKGLS